MSEERPMNVLAAPDLEARVQALIQEHDIRFVYMQFTDIAGQVKQISIPITQWAHAKKNGIWFDGSSIEGFARIAESDMFLQPDLSTFAVIPWIEEKELATARCICDCYLPNGEPFDGDPRHILKRAIARAAKMGFGYNVGPEFEFFLFKRHADGVLLPLEVHDEAGYFDVTTDKAHRVRREMMRCLQEFGIVVEADHHEVATGQHEIDVRYGDALKMADNAVTIRVALKAVARRSNLYCTFMPKPVGGINGSGLHVHQSLYSLSNGQNLMFDPENPTDLSALAKSYVAGQLEHAKGFCAVACPLVNSYKRLVIGHEAPVYLSWAQTNRSALIRVPRIRPNQPESTRVELRCPDPCANPYLLFAVILNAGLDGIEAGSVPPPKAEEDLFSLNHVDRMDFHTLPGDLGEAIKAMKKDESVRTTLGEHTFERYAALKTLEWDSYKLFVSRWEIDRYLSIY